MPTNPSADSSAPALDDDVADNLPPSQYLMMEVLAGRYRLGESLWTFRTRERGPARGLELLGLVSVLSGITEGTIRVALTPLGIRTWKLDRPWPTVAERRDAAADETALGKAIRPAWHAVVHVLLAAGPGVSDEVAADAALGEVLGPRVLDWGYVRATDPETGETVPGDEGLQRPLPLFVSRPYTKGSFLTDDEG